MGRGTGFLQQQILNYAPASRRPEIVADLSYRGKVGWGPDNGVSAYGFTVVMADGVYDLRAVLRVIANRQKRIRNIRESDYPEVDGGLQASFSKAVKGLVRRGLLIPLAALPYAELVNDREARRRDELSRHDPRFRCIYLGYSSRQVRFVRIADSGNAEMDAALAVFDCPTRPDPTASAASISALPLSAIRTNRTCREE